jgi:hypothetical protein
LSYAIAGYAMNLAALYYGPEFDWVDACSVSVFRDLDSPAMHTMLRSLRDAMRANSIISDGSGGRLTVPPLSLEPAPEVFKDLQRIFTQHTNAISAKLYYEFLQEAVAVFREIEQAPISMVEVFSPDFQSQHQGIIAEYELYKDWRF